MKACNYKHTFEDISTTFDMLQCHDHTKYASFFCKIVPLPIKKSKLAAVFTYSFFEF